MYSKDVRVLENNFVSHTTIRLTATKYQDNIKWCQVTERCLFNYQAVVSIQISQPKKHVQYHITSSNTSNRILLQLPRHWVLPNHQIILKLSTIHHLSLQQEFHSNFVKQQIYFPYHPIIKLSSTFQWFQVMCYRILIAMVFKTLKTSECKYSISQSHEKLDKYFLHTLQI